MSLVRNQPYTEETIATYYRQIAEGIRFLHEYEIIHKNLKPENILLSSREPDAIVKITDANLSAFLADDMDIELVCCNPKFCAPELLVSRKFDKAFDLWAMGILLYIILNGSDPYHPLTEKELYGAILNGAFEFTGDVWLKISLNGRDVVKRLLVVDKNQRWNTAQILTNPWVLGEHTPSVPLEIPHARLKEYMFRREAEHPVERESEEDETGLFVEHEVVVFDQAVKNEERALVIYEEIRTHSVTMCVAAREDLMIDIDEVHETTYTPMLRPISPMLEEILGNAITTETVEGDGVGPDINDNQERALLPSISVKETTRPTSAAMETSEENEEGEKEDTVVQIEKEEEVEDPGEEIKGAELEKPPMEQLRNSEAIEETDGIENHLDSTETT